MTRDALLASIRQTNPEYNGMSDDDALYEAASKYESQGVIDQFPALKFELTKQRAEAKAARGRGFFSNLATAATRGFASGAQGLNVLQGAEDPTNAQDIVDWENIKAANPNSREMQDFMEQQGFVNSAVSFLKNPLRITSEVIAESLAQSLPSLVGGTVGATIGAAEGLKDAGPYGAAVGAAVGTGVGSFATEYSNKILDTLQSQGMDLTDPVSITQFFSDPERVAAARELAVKRAIPVAAFDAASAGFAGRFVQPLRQIAEKGGEVAVRKVLSATAKEIALQAGTGMAGEFGGQLAADEPYDGKAVFLEGLGEVGSAPVEIRNNLRETRGGHARPAVEATLPPPATEAEAVARKVRAPLSPTIPPVAQTFNPAAAAPVVVGPPVDPSIEAAAKAARLRDELAAARAAAVRGVPVGGQMILPGTDIREAMRTRGNPAIGEIDATPDLPGTSTEVPSGTPTLFDYGDQVARAQAQTEAIANRSRAAQQAKLAIIAQLSQMADTTDKAKLAVVAEMARRADLDDQTKAAIIAQIAKRADLLDQAKVAMIGKMAQMADNEDAAVATPAATPAPTTPAPVPVPTTPTPVVAEPTPAPAPVVAAAPKKIFTIEDIKPKKVYSNDHPLSEIPGRKQGLVGAVLHLADGSLKLVKVLIGPNKIPVAEAFEPNRGRYAIIDQIAQEEEARAAQDPTAETLSKSNANAFLFNHSPFTDAHEVDVPKVRMSVESAEKQNARLRVANRAIELGWFNKRGSGSVPLAKLAKDLKARVRNIVELKSPLAPGLHEFQDSTTTPLAQVPDAKFQPKSTSEDVKMLSDRALEGAGKRNRERAQTTLEKLHGKSEEELKFIYDKLVDHLGENSLGITPEDRQRLTDELVGKEGESKLKRSILRAAWSAERILRDNHPAETSVETAPAPAASSPVATTVAPVVSPTTKPATTVAPVVSGHESTMEDLANLSPKQRKKVEKAIRAFLKDGNTKHLTGIDGTIDIPENLAVEYKERLIDEAAKEKDSHAVAELFSKQEWDTDAMRRVRPEEIVDARRSLRFPEDPDDYRRNRTSAQTRDMVNGIVYSMLRRGIKVTVSEATGDMRAGGSYKPSTRTVSLVLDSVAHPTEQSVLDALHEVMHDIVGTAPLDVQKAFHDLVERTPNGDLAFYRRPEADPRSHLNYPGLTPEQRTIERGVEHLTFFGLDAEYSRGVLSAFFRTVKDLYYRGAMYLQRKLLGDENTTGRLAKQWMENEVVRILAGDQKSFDSFLTQFGLKPSFADAFQVLHPESTRPFAVKLDMNSGTIDYRPLLSLDDAEQNIAARIQSAKESAVANGTWGLDQKLKELDDLFGPEVMQREITGEVLHREQPFMGHTATVLLQNAKTSADAAIAVANTMTPVYQRILELTKKTNVEFTTAQREAWRRAGTPVPANIETMADLLTLLRARDPEMRADELAKFAEQAIEAEFGEKPPEGYINRALTMDQLPEGAVLDEADMMITEETVRMRNKLANRMAAISSEIEQLENKRERNAATIQAIMMNLADAKVSRTALHQGIVSRLQELARSIAQTTDVEQAYGETAGILEALESEKSRTELASQYTDRLMENIPVGELPLHSIVKAMHEAVQSAGLSLADSPVKDVRNAIFNAARADSTNPVNHLVELGDGPMAKAKGTALLSALLEFAKSESFITEVINIQMSEGAERAKAINALRTVYGETNERLLSELADETKKLKPTTSYAKMADEGSPGTEAAIFKMMRKRDEALRENTRLANLKKKHAVIESALSAFEQMVLASEQRMEVGSPFVMTDGGRYLDAGTPDMKSSTILRESTSPNRKLRLSGPGAMTPEERIALINRNQAWIDARKGDVSKQDRVYHSLVQQNFEMRGMLQGENARAMIRGIRNGRFTGIGEILLRTGTRAGERMASLFNQWVGYQRVFASPGEIKGKEFEVARAKFQHAIKADIHTVKDLFYNPALHYLNILKGMPEKDAFAFLDKRFKSVPHTARYWNQPGASAAFFELMRKTRENNQLRSDWHRRVGADRVRDEKLTGIDVFNQESVQAMERRWLEMGVDGYTTTRNLHPELANWAATFARKVAGDGNINLFADLALKTEVASMRQGLGEKMKALFTERDWNAFLEPLLRNEQGGVPTPLRKDGVRTVVRPADIQAILDGNGRDLLKVIDTIWDQYGDKLSETGRQEYTREVLSWINKEWKFVRNMSGAAESQVAGSKIAAVKIPSLGIDARDAQRLPMEWMTYPQFTPEDNHRAAHQISAIGLFGRNGDVLNQGLLDLDKEVRARKDLVKEKGLPTETVDDPAWEQLKKEDPETYKKLRDIQEYVSPEFQKIMTSIFNTERDLWTESRVLREIFGGMTTGMVTGLRTALKNPISTLNLINIQHSASSDTIKSVGGAYAKTGRLFLAAVGELFGVNTLRDNPYLKAMREQGVFDSASRETIGDLTTGERGVNDNLGKYARAFRIARTVFSQMRLSPFSKNGVAPAIRLFNPFMFTQQLVNMGNSWQLMQMFHDMAVKGSSVYRAKADSTRLLTAADVGMSDKVAFDARRRLLAENGVSLEDLALRVARGQNILDNKFVMAVNNISTGGLANESSLLNRPVFMSQSKAGQMAGTFVGWGIDQTNKFLRLAETPDGRHTAMSVARGLGIMGLALLPASLAYAALLDEWDELVERKQNRIPVLNGPEGWGEAVASVGTAGLVGDLVDGITSTRQQTAGWGDSLSLDNRIVIISSAKSFVRAMSNVVQTGGKVNYANIGRPFFQAMGANGIMQNAYLVDKLFGGSLQSLPAIGGILKEESSVALRSNLYNYIRAAGRENGLEVRTQGGGGYTITPLTTHITDMTLAALQNNPRDFQAAYKDAIKEAIAEGYPDPMAKVQQSFSQRHPLKVLFNGTPLASEYVRVLNSMSPAGRKAVEQGIHYFNSYAAALGADPFVGSTDFNDSQVHRLVMRRNPVDLIKQARAKANSLIGL